MEMMREFSIVLYRRGNNTLTLNRWKHAAGLLVLTWSINDTFIGWNFHFFPERKCWTWGHTDGDHYDGVKLDDWGFGPLFMLSVARF